jgi:hypothetical protein
MPAKNILIFTAVPMETRAVQKAVRGSACRVHAVGIGGRRLPAAAWVSEAELILLCGVAGGLDPSLVIGDIVIDDSDGMIPAEIECRRGAIHSAEKIVSSPEEKAELFARTGALAVDMEQTAVRTFAAGIGIPVVGIRAVSDTAQQNLDPVVVRLVDDRGNPRAGSIAKNLLLRPSLIPYLRALNKNTNIALASLGETVRRIVENLEGS